MRRTFCLLMVIALLMSLCGCQPSSSNSGNSSTPGSSSPTDHDTNVTTAPTVPGPDTSVPNTEPSGPIPSSTAIDFAAQYIRTDGYHPNIDYPQVIMIRTYDELQQYYRENCGEYDLERRTDVANDSTIGFLDACNKYDPVYFDENLLMMVLLQVGSGSIRHEVTNVCCYDSGEWNITIEEVAPGGDCDMANWHILIELNKDCGIDSKQVYISLEPWEW